MGRARGYSCATLMAALCAGSLHSTALGQVRFHVDSAALGANDGTSWSDAFTDLQSALTAAHQSDAPLVDVWVAAGTYLPGLPGSDRSISFELKSGVRVWGGFLGDETRLSQRNLVLNPTILSGDLNGDDDLIPLGSTCCEGQEVTGCDDPLCQSLVCKQDPFCCDERWDQTCAALTECLCGDLCSSRCDNSYHVVVARGVDPSAALDGFTITAGNANGDTGEDASGGGLLLVKASPTISRCVFLGNNAESDGGGVFSDGGSAMVNCSFLGNTASRGGGLHAADGSAVLVNAVFSGNSSRNGGGAISHADGILSVINSTLTGNAGSPGGGVRSTGESSTRIDNSIVWGNEANGSFDESAQISVGNAGDVRVNFSCIEGLTGSLGGLGNIGDDPEFVDPDGSDDVPGTIDDNVRLTSPSPCIDSAQNAAVPPDFADLDLDDVRTEVTPLDGDGFARFFDDPRIPNTGQGTSPIVDMGAYEVAGDCNDNGILDDKDVADETSADCNGNKIPDECEIRSDSTAPGGPYYCMFDCDRDCDDDGIPDNCQDDDDGDGVIDVCDLCSETAPELPVDQDGCELPGACCFDVDVCFNETLSGQCALIGGDFLGHSLSCEGDADNDGAAGCSDGCPLDGNKTEPGICGCGVADSDSDLDGVADCLDPCPADNPDDTDGDGVCDSDDPCPLDNPDDPDGDGVCQSDDPCPLDNPDDTDGDGACDSDDLCPNDPEKTEPGICGCGLPDVDSDLDGVYDCFDECADTPPETPVDDRGCPAQGACCFRVAGKVICVDDTLPQDCELVGGAYHGNQSICDDGCRFAGDFDGDGDVDGEDVASFVACLTGPLVTPRGGCEPADFDADDHVDLRDVADLQNQFTGALE